MLVEDYAGEEHRADATWLSVMQESVGKLHKRLGGARASELQAGAYTRPLFSSTLAVLVTPSRVPLSNRLGENHAPNVSHKTCLG